MLERTAAGLESRSLQRVLTQPASSTPKRACRRLHTAFWQHGASAIELASLCPPLPTPQDHDNAASKPSPATLLSSAFLLDFLYPTGARSLLRQCLEDVHTYQRRHVSGSLLERRHDNQAIPFSMRTSTAVESRLSKEEVEAQIRHVREVKHTTYTEKSSHVPTSRISSDHRGHPNKTIRRPGYNALATKGGFRSSPETAQGVKGNNRAAKTPRSSSAGMRHPRSQAEVEAVQNQDAATRPSMTLSKILQEPQRWTCDDAWEAYQRLNETDQSKHHSALLGLLTTSVDPVNAGRALQLSRLVKDNDWSSTLQSSVISALLNADELSEALKRLRYGLSKHGLSEGVDAIVLHCIRRQAWDSLVETWMAICTAQNGLHTKHALRHLPELQVIPNLGERYLSFARHVETHHTAFHLHVNSPEKGASSLASFKRSFAIQALRQPCEARQAAPILASLQEHEQYQKYLLRILNHWLVKGDVASGALGLWVSDIYEAFRSLPGAKPSRLLLDRLFDYYSQFKEDGIDMIYQDWQQSYKTMPQRVYEKFLTRLARRGHSQAVSALWQEYVKAYPQMLHENRGWRSMINVHAQTGDIVALEATLAKMKEQYEVDLDTGSLNILLKCYVRSDDYAKVLEAFDRVQNTDLPDSWSYAHVMAMSAKKGDLSRTIDLFSEAQKRRLPVIREMMLPVSMAYCRNGRPKEALRVLKQLTHRYSTSTQAWNEILSYYAIKGDMDNWTIVKVAMETSDVHADSTTHQLALRALVNSGNVADAYAYLLKSCEERGILLTAQHFAIVIAGAIQGGEWGLVRRLQLLMHKSGISMNFNTHVLLVEAAYKAKASSGHAKTLARDLPRYLEALLSGSSMNQYSIGSCLTCETTEMARPKPTPTTQISSMEAPRLTQMDSRKVRDECREMGRATRLLIEMEEFQTVDQLVKLYLDLFPQHKDPYVPLPNKITSALMVAYFNRRHFKEVRDLWDRCWTLTIGRSRKPEGGIYPANQFDLCRPLDAVIRTLREQGEGKALLTLVQETLHWGFRLTQSNWTLAITYLGELGELGHAMHYCEKYLMPAWRGWGDRRVVHDEKREYHDTRVLRATPNLILALQREWVGMQGLAAWSGPISRLLQSSEERYPKLYQAFATSEVETVQMRNSWNFPEAVHFRMAAKQLLNPMRSAELWRMSVVLRGYMTHKWRRRMLSGPFKRRVVGGAGRTELRDLGTSELDVLHEMLQARMEEEKKVRQRIGSRSKLAKRNYFAQLRDEETEDMRQVLENARYTGPSVDSAAPWTATKNGRSSSSSLSSSSAPSTTSSPGLQNASDDQDGRSAPGEYINQDSTPWPPLDFAALQRERVKLLRERNREHLEEEEDGEEEREAAREQK